MEITRTEAELETKKIKSMWRRKRRRDFGRLKEQLRENEEEKEHEEGKKSHEIETQTNDT
jgi:hypothetical protein